MKISTTLSKLIILTLLLVPKDNLAQNHTINVKGTQIQISSTLKTVFDQAETVYAPSGYTMDVLYKDAPEMAVIFIGLIMQRQEIYLNEVRNVEHLKNRTALNNEITQFIGELAKAHNYINPLDGSKLSPIQMHKDFKSAINGNFNNVYINKFGINPKSTNIAYLLDRAPNPNNVGNTDEHAKIDVAEAPTEINLFGEVSGAADDGGLMQRKIDRNKKYKIPPADAILGTWQGRDFGQKNDRFVTFQKKEGRYVSINVRKYEDYTKTTVYTITDTEAYKLNIYKSGFLSNDCRIYSVTVKTTHSPKKYSHWNRSDNERIIMEHLIGSDEYKINYLFSSTLKGYIKKI